MSDTDTDVQPSAERDTPQVDSPQPATAQTLVRHETLSYEDGNIMVVAENIMFQVHRSVLARKSALFKDLLSLPQPDTGETIESLPVVRLLDSSADAAMLIDAIYNGERYRYREYEGPEWPTVHRLLTIGTKYQVEDLREEAIQQLQRRYPKKILEWDETCRTNNDFESPSTVLISYSIDDDIAIANVARTMDLPDIHLAALYGCCSLPFDVLVNGRTLEDGSCERLCPSDLIACLQGKENLFFTARAHIRWHLFASETPPVDCHTLESCAEKTLLMQRRYRTADPSRPIRMYDPLRPEDDEIERQCADVGMCHDCIKFYIARHATLRQDIRSNLDKYICASRKL